MQAILFDLDGTLLPMDMAAFTQGYFGLLAKKAAPRGYAPQELIDGIWQGTKAMVQNDGSMCNKDRFWQTFAERFGQRAYADIALFDDFYVHEFQEAVRFTQPAPEAAQAAVKAARMVAKQVILATNPLFPAEGVATRLRWIGLSPADFDYITSYENASYCKPSRGYYEEILPQCRLAPQDCLMIGNDVDEDILPAASAGLQTHLVRDCMIHQSGAAFGGTSGTLAELPGFLLRARECRQ